MGRGAVIMIVDSARNGPRDRASALVFRDR
jgi:hypothetical protein